MRDKSFINLDIIWISALRNDENCSPLKTNWRFESSVNSDSIQTEKVINVEEKVFESSVNSDSIQTGKDWNKACFWFESSVNSDSIQTEGIYDAIVT